MAKLRFSFGTMGSGKSTLALQIHHNLSSRGLHGLLCSQLDRAGGKVSSALGVSADAVEVGPRLNLYELAVAMQERHGRLDYMVCDEAQFYLTEQVDQLARIVDELGADVYTFGLLTSFQGLLFDGTRRLLEMADESVEVQVEARCWCGSQATHNARIVDGVQVYDGELFVVDDPENHQVTYDLRCRRHWLSGDSGLAHGPSAVLGSVADLTG
ncbi:MAG: thymidine kinase [Acidimicrobiaceae bacterium]|jgi:thymidine kinase|nr:thymidine kinase [Acidimicrobiaceae bacterium]MDP6481802.1 thymidine kinase [Acidimicrobiales bacterium]MDP6697879.1 thymidine kinase [Acidimicrobiales bacterium]|tara:strand:- start:371 stop:1009 length:639 start_codon:yes stop_codon:yes gene_type:complete